MDKYIPPYDLTDEMLDLTAQIMEKIGRLDSVNDLERLPRLRKVSRIKSIHSSLAIENNTLTMQQVTEVLNGKRVLAPEEDVCAVRNAFDAYKKIGNIDPYSVEDLLRIYKIMMNGLIRECGKLRSTQVGVCNQNGEVIHVAPPHDMVSPLINQLFAWLKESKANMLIKSSVFHYEFEFIHPFCDGNGRMGRLWQTALLASWKPIFAWIPIESIIKDQQEKYYQAIKLSTSQGKSNAFIVFMLNIILNAVSDILHETREHQNHISTQVSALLGVLQSYPMTAKELMDKLGLKSRDGFRKHYLAPAIEAGLIGMTQPDKPTSRNQRYFKI